MESGLRIAALLAAALLLTGCATASNCAGWKPISPSSRDQLTAGTARQLLGHNKQGVAQGCWRAPR